MEGLNGCGRADRLFSTRPPRHPHRSRPRFANLDSASIGLTFFDADVRGRS
jgi:hypothetical protein